MTPDEMKKAAVAAGLDVLGVPTSERTAAVALQSGVPLTTLEEVDGLDLAVDGADEFDLDLRLIKGGGGALLREKIVAADSRRFIVITDESKRVEALGAFPLPIEVVPFGIGATLRAVGAAASSLGLSGPLVPRVGSDGARFVTDQGNWIVDAHFRRISDPQALAAALSAIPGCVEHGLFIGLAATIIVAGRTGIARYERPPH
jgi:ribose 5-phosphate isomerase A